MTPQERKVMELAFEALKENQHLVADNERHAYVMEYNSIIEKCEEALAQTKQEPATYSAWGLMGGDEFVNKDSLNRNIT